MLLIPIESHTAIHEFRIEVTQPAPLADTAYVARIHSAGLLCDNGAWMSAHDPVTNHHSIRVVSPSNGCYPPP